MITTIARQRISEFQENVNSHVHAVRQIGRKAWETLDLSKQEPRIIYDFLSNPSAGVSYLNQNLASTLSESGRVVKFAGIFLHQKPMVQGWIRDSSSIPPQKRRLQGRCELGDLQLVFLYLAEDKTICQCRSIIFQAKRAQETGPFVINHPLQRKLYDECAGFDYATVLKGQSRTFPDGALRERALQYLFVGQQPIQARTIPADRARGASMDFGEMLHRFLNDSTGLDVHKSRSGDMGWSQVVWDMIDHVAQEAVNGNQIRSTGITGLLDHFNSFEDRENFFLSVPEEEPEDGTGLLYVIVWDPELGGGNAEGTTLCAGLPFKLLAAAEDYLDMDDSPENRQDASGDMAAIIRDQSISRCQVATVAKEHRHEGLAVGLAAAIREEPEPHDIARLLAIANSALSPYAREQVVYAFLELAFRKMIPDYLKHGVEAVAEGYREGANQLLSQVIDKLLYILWHSRH